MALNIGVGASTGASLFATLQRLSDGFYWSVAASAWQAAPTLANKKVTLAEGSGENAQSYTASVTGLGDAGKVFVRVHDDAAAGDPVVSGGQTYVWGGEEVLPTETSATATAVWAAAARTLTAIDEDATALDLDATVRAAVGLAAANLDTQLGNLAAAVTALPNNVAPAVWNELTDDYVGSDGTFGKFVQDQFDALPTAAEVTTAVWAAGTRSLTAGAITSTTFAAGAITETTVATPAETAGRPTTLLGMMRRLFEGRHNKRTRNRTTGVLTLRNAADSATLETATQSTVGSTDTQTAGA